MLAADRCSHPDCHISYPSLQKCFFNTYLFPLFHRTMHLCTIVTILMVLVCVHLICCFIAATFVHRYFAQTLLSICQCICLIFPTIMRYICSFVRYICSLDVPLRPMPPPSIIQPLCSFVNKEHFSRLIACIQCSLPTHAVLWSLHRSPFKP